MVVTGQVVDFSSAGLRLRLDPTGIEQFYPAEDVRDIETPRHETHERGLARWREGDFREAEREFEDALAMETRAWMRRELLAELVRCGVARRNWTAAGTRYQALHRSDAGTHHLRIIPLAWKPIDLPAGMRATALKWLRSEDEMPRLMASSWLLFDQEENREAGDTLRRLAQTVGGRIGELAQWQLRRGESLRGRVARTELQLWEKAAGHLHPDLQAGPAYLMGSAWLGLEEHSLAAAWWTRLTVQGRFDWQLAALATREAGDALARIGQREEAEVLWREAVVEFAGTEGAAEAGRRLKRTSSPTTESTLSDHPDLNGIKP